MTKLSKRQQIKRLKAQIAEFIRALLLFLS